MATLKEQKEAFVTGFEGTHPGEILLVCSSGIVGFWLFSVLPDGWAQQPRRPLSMEVYLFWLPMILVQSNFLYPWGILYLILEVVLAIVLELRLLGTSSKTSSSSTPTTKTTNPPSSNDSNDPPSKRNEEKGQQQQQRQYHGALTMHRVIVMYLTFVAILAVDFSLFPRRFVKTETSGYSLMDVGAASFALMAGLASPRARYGIRPNTNHAWMKKELRRVIPLLVMGSLRLVTHKELEYQEHVSEYGVHWNFFYTLAALGPLTAVVPGPSWMVPALLMMVYQYALSYGGLQALIEEAPRKCNDPSFFLCDLFMANREGILGCIGYVTIYLIGEWTGKTVLWNSTTTNTSNNSDTVMSSTRKLAVMSVAVIVLWRAFVATGIPISRRSTNLGFCLWTLVVNIPLLTLLMLIYHRHGPRVPHLAHLVNRHGLVCFIVANLLTGIVNLSINTLQVGDGVAIGVLLAYMTAMGLFVIVFDTTWNHFFPKSKQA